MIDFNQVLIKFKSAWSKKHWTQLHKHIKKKGKPVNLCTKVKADKADKRCVVNVKVSRQAEVGNTVQTVQKENRERVSGQTQKENLKSWGYV